PAAVSNRRLPKVPIVVKDKPNSDDALVARGEPDQFTWNGLGSIQLDWVVLCSGDVNGSYQPSNSTSRVGSSAGNVQNRRTP
ncbi:MAG: hypothetical protein ACKOX4_00930, partial [Bacteroidota bacterium]